MLSQEEINAILNGMNFDYTDEQNDDKKESESKNEITKSDEYIDYNDWLAKIKEILDMYYGREILLKVVEEFGAELDRNKIELESKEQVIELFEKYGYNKKLGYIAKTNKSVQNVDPDGKDKKISEEEKLEGIVKKILDDLKEENKLSSENSEEKAELDLKNYIQEKLEEYHVENSTNFVQEVLDKIKATILMEDELNQLANIDESEEDEWFKHVKKVLDKYYNLENGRGIPNKIILDFCSLIENTIIVYDSDIINYFEINYDVEDILKMIKMDTLKKPKKFKINFGNGIKNKTKGRRKASVDTIQFILEDYYAQEIPLEDIKRFLKYLNKQEDLKDLGVESLIAHFGKFTKGEENKKNYEEQCINYVRRILLEYYGEVISEDIVVDFTQRYFKTLMRLDYQDQDTFEFIISSFEKFKERKINKCRKSKNEIQLKEKIKKLFKKRLNQDNALSFEKVKSCLVENGLFLSIDDYLNFFDDLCLEMSLGKKINTQEELLELFNTLGYMEKAIDTGKKL